MAVWHCALCVELLKPVDLRRDRTKHSMGVQPGVNGAFEARVPAKIFGMLPEAARLGVTLAARKTAALAVVDNAAAARTLKLPSELGGPPPAVDLRLVPERGAYGARGAWGTAEERQAYAGRDLRMRGEHAAAAGVTTGPGWNGKLARAQGMDAERFHATLCDGTPSRGGWMEMDVDGNGARMLCALDCCQLAGVVRPAWHTL